jgi:hypothetical protein
MLTVYEDEFIKIDWNESKMFNVFFAIGENGEFREVDVFTSMEEIDVHEAKEMAKEHAQECQETLETNPTPKA